jgi:putative ABC transport system permease protein
VFAHLRMILHQIAGDLRCDPLRFGLPVGALAVGAISIVCLSSLVISARQFVVRLSTASLQADVLHIARTTPGKPYALRSTRLLATGDAVALAESPVLGAVAISTTRELDQEIRFRDQRQVVRFVAGDTRLPYVQRLEVARGRFLNEQDLRNRRKVAVVGSGIWRRIASDPAALDSAEIRTADDRFRVVGVLRERPGLRSYGAVSWDDRVILPETVFELTQLPEPAVRKEVSSVMVRLPTLSETEEGVAAVGVLARRLLLRRHLGVPNFEVTDTAADPRSRLIGLVVFLLLLGTGALCFAIGGVNNLNTMLACVAERTREVGVRRALGASRAAIALQFLLEAVAISLAAGVIGVLVGVSISAVTSAVVGRLIDDWTLCLPAWSLWGPVGLAVVVGGGFGIVPALRAARLDPCEALRFQ